MLRSIYRSLELFLVRLRLYLYVSKTWLFEWLAIISKRKLTSSVDLTPDQIAMVETFSQKAYGKRMSTRWHRLYQSINGVFDEKYLPDIIFSTRIEPRLNPIEYAKLYSDKGLTELLYSGIDKVRFPKTILLKSGGYFYDGNRQVITPNQAITLLEAESEFVIKPTLGGSSGHGVSVIDGHFDANALFLDYEDDFIVQEKLKPHAAYAKIYSNAINTIRLITYIADNKVRHAPVCLRVGTAGNKVDNIHSGGLVVGVSDDGFLLEWAYRLGYCDSKERFSRHPDSDVPFLGYQIPGVPSIIKAGKELHGRTPKLGIISWDFMIDFDGNVVLVEGNYFGQSVWFPQIVHGKSIFGDDLKNIM